MTPSKRAWRLKTTAMAVVVAEVALAIAMIGLAVLAMLIFISRPPFTASSRQPAASYIARPSQSLARLPLVHPVVGQTISTTPGGWTNGPMGFTYRWERCDTRRCSLAGWGARYKVGPGDAGFRLRVTVTAWNNLGGTSRQPVQTALVSAGKQRP